MLSQADLVVIDQKEVDTYDLIPFIEVLEDTTGKMDVRSVIFNESFTPLTSYEGEFDMDYAYWGKLNILNLDSGQQTWLIYFNRNDYINIYEFKANKGISHQKTGYLVPGSEKKIVAGSYYAPLILPYRMEKTVYFRITQQIHKHNFSLFTLENPFNVMKRTSNREIYNLVFQGFIWIMLLYNLLIFIHFRDKAGLYYSLYLLAIAIIYLFAEGIIRETFMSENPLGSSYFINVLFLTPFFYYLFMKEFLQIEVLVPFWDKVLRWMGVTSLMLFFVGSVFFLITYDFLLIMKVTRIVTLGVSAIAFTATIAILRSKHILVNYFVWGTFVVALGGIIDSVIWDSGNSWGDFARLGFTAEILLFSLGLGKRMKLVEIDKQVAQQKLIDELRKNEQFVADQKDQLEKEVESRTKELALQNKQLEKAKEEAERGAQAKSDFLSVMSHEIRTPMNSIIGMTHLLMEDNPQPRQMENLKSLKFSGNSLVQLINEILDLNKIESGKIDLEFTEFDFRDLMKRLNHMFKPRADSKGVKLNVEVDAIIERFLIGDPARLSQILNNLVGNAIKFTEEGKVEIRVSVKRKIKTNMELLFEIEDTGVGIAEDKLDAIFDNFTQAASSTTRKFGGTGLGLAISKKLLELHGSSIHVESKLGEGSTFSFSLKFRKVMDPDKLEKISNQVVEYLPLQGLNVLIVDDNILNRMVVEQFLRKWDVKYDSVDGGEPAIEKVEENDYHVILLDIQMPGMDGYEVARIIRMRTDTKKEVPIIALSADIYSNVYDRIIAAGMDDFVSKPFKPEELYSILKNYYSLIVSE